MVNENFGTLKDLYERVLPALKSKVKELENNHISFVTEKDVWDCLRKNKWNGETDLTLYDIVNDILFIEEKEILDFMHFKQETHIEYEKPQKQEKIAESDSDTIL